MITLHILIERLADMGVSDKRILRDDAISSVRILSGGAITEHILYISADTQPGRTRCHTARGSSFLLHTELPTALNRILDAIDRCESWQRQLHILFQRGCTLTELLEASYPILPYPVFILDSNQRILGFTPAFEHTAIGPDWEELLHLGTSPFEKIAAFNAEFSHHFRRKGVYKVPGEIFCPPAYAWNLFHGQTLCGIVILIEFEQPMTQGSLDIFSLLCERLQETISSPTSNQAFITSESPFYTFLTRPDPESRAKFLRLLQSLRWKAGDPKLVMYAQAVAASKLSPNPQHTKNIFSRIGGVLATNHGQGVVVLCDLRILNGPAIDIEFTQLLSQIAYSAGTSTVFTDPDMLQSMFAQARVSYEHGEQAPGRINSYQDLALPYLISLIQKEDPHTLEHPVLEQLRRYDRRHGSSLYSTLFCFLKNERNITETAAELNIHRSTLNHRLQRLGELLQGALDKPETRLHLLLAYYADTQSAQAQ